MTARTTIVPVNLNSSALAGGSFPSAPSTGLDAAGTGGTSFATAWPGTATGVQFQNNGLLWLWYYNGATACTAYALIGQKAAGATPVYTTWSAVLATTGYGWLGPWNPAQFNQEDATVHSGAPGGAIGASAVGLCCIDFSATTTLAVRLYQTIPA